MKISLLVICLLIEISYSLNVFESLANHAKQSEFIAKLINHKHTARVESEKFLLRFLLSFV